MPSLILSFCFLLVATVTTVTSIPITYHIVNSELVRLGEQPMKTVFAYLPASATDILTRNRTRIPRCYGRYPGQKNLFEDSLRDVVYQYMAHKYKNKPNMTEKNYRYHIYYLNRNIHFMLGYIIDCVAGNTAMGMGLTSRSDMPPGSGGGHTHRPHPPSPRVGLKV